VVVWQLPGLDLEQHRHCRHRDDPAIVPALPGSATTTCSAGVRTGTRSSSSGAQPRRIRLLVAYEYVTTETGKQEF
jgi:hypothetical protein